MNYTLNNYMSSCLLLPKYITKKKIHTELKVDKHISIVYLKSSNVSCLLYLECQEGSIHTPVPLPHDVHGKTNYFRKLS